MKVNSNGQYYLEEVYEYKEKLSIKDYLELHQQLWNTVVKIITEYNFDYCLEEIKYQSFIDSGLCKKFPYPPISYCWCCEFCKDIPETCGENCLVDWGNDRGCRHIYSPYIKFYFSLIENNKIEAAKEAVIIRDLSLNKRYENEKE